MFRDKKLTLLILGFIFGFVGGIITERAFLSKKNSVGLTSKPLQPRGVFSEDIQTLLNIAHSFLDSKDYTSALDTYKKVLNLDSNNVEAITHIGNIYFYTGELDKALKQYDIALSIDSQYAHALYDKGYALNFGKEDRDGAVKVWERFLKLMPEDSEDYKRVKGWVSDIRKRSSGR